MGIFSEMNWNLLNQRNLRLEDLIRHLSPVNSQQIHNPFFLIDLLIHIDAIYKITRDKSITANFLSRYQIPFGNHCYDEELYMFLRNLSISSGFEFNRILEENYQKKFSMPIESQAEVVNKIKNDGYIVFGASLESQILAAKILSSLDRLVVIREVDGEIDMLDKLKLQNKKGSFRYFYQEKDLPIFDILNYFDQSGIKNVIDGYLGSPILRNVNAWHSAALDSFTDTEESFAAQKYHFDMDIPSGWIKVFIYLSNVRDISSGPHVYVPKSHKKLNSKLLRDGRFEDEEINACYEPGKAVLGDSGTIILANTRGFHKGLTVKKNARTIFQLEFSNSLIGSETPKISNAKQIIESLGFVGDSRLITRYLRDISLGYK